MLTMAPNAPRRQLRDRTVLYVLLTIDVVMIGLAILQGRGVIADPRFSLEVERGFPEWVQYVKYAVAALLLFRNARRGFGATAAVWASLFVVLLVEDSFQIHEHGGFRLSLLIALPQIGGMAPNQLGEVIVAATEGLVLIGALAWVLRSASAESWALSIVLFAGLLALTTFGVVVDAAHSLVDDRWFAPALGYIEDGGEMIAASVLVWIVWLWR
jgi:hypothetical protein